MSRKPKTSAARFGGPLTAGRARQRRRRISVAAALRLVGAAILVVAIAYGAPSADAEEVFTSQAAAANATDTTWIPAPEKRAAVCIIDTGVDMTPDTTNVIARFATDGGTPDDLNAGKHGTLMAMIASAPYNGFGMVGAAPSINVVSVRASTDGETFGGTQLKAAVQLCINKRSTYNIKVISLSLGGPVGASTSQKADLESMVDAARYYGLNVVAAAGNSGEAAVDWPAAYGPTYAVGALDATGDRCALASFGPEVDIWAQGCPLEVASPDLQGAAAWAYGSSESAALVAAVLTQLRGVAPDLTVAEAERLLLIGAGDSRPGPRLDAEGALVQAGLQQLLVEGHTRRPKPSSDFGAADGVYPPNTPSAVPSSGVGVAAPTGPRPPASRPVRSPAVEEVTPRLRLSLPSRPRITYRRRTLMLVFRGKPKGVAAQVKIFGRRKGATMPGLVATLRARGDRTQMRISGKPTSLSITYHDSSAKKDSSAPLSIVLRP